VSGEWKLLADGVWCCRLLPAFLSLYVFEDVDGMWWARVNSRLVKRSFPSKAEAQDIAVRGAKKLLGEAMEILK
jgi:hypothetical protein